MARIEKTVFISYRRKDISWALAVYQYLTSQKYDVFFDFSSLSSGDFEQVIVSNIKARAHFVLILTPTALDRCSEPRDWLRREIEIAVDEKRNVIPLFFDGFNFGSPAIAEKLTGKLSAINRYNGLDIPSGYFMEAMGRLSNRYLNVPLDAVIHPVSTEVLKVVKEEQVAADKALIQKSEDIKELVKPAEEKISETKQDQSKEAVLYNLPLNREIRSVVNKPNLRLYGIGVGILLIATLGIFGINSLMPNTFAKDTPTPTDHPPVSASTSTLTHIVPAETFTLVPTEELILSTSTPGIGSTMISPKDGMTLLYVPDGNFTMGKTAEDALADCNKGGSISNCQLNWFIDENPPHPVYLDAFWIDQTEVTNEMYSICVKDGLCREPQVDTYYQNLDFANHPVVNVDWDDAKSYCSWADRRLPTEAEWEKAASWDEDKKIQNVYPWGDGINCSYTNYNDGSKQCVGKTTAVGSYPKGVSPYGAFDMAGNVWEWVNDWYDKDYYGTLVDSFPNPQGPSNGEQRVRRGGSWYTFDFDVRSSDREKSNPKLLKDYIGFRCAESSP